MTIQQALIRQPDDIIYTSFFNEEQFLPELYARIIDAMNDIDKKYEIPFINHGSTVRSPELISDFCTKAPRVKTINPRKNFGKSAALQVGFKSAKGEIILTFGYDLVTGWKLNRKDLKEKTIPSKVFNFFVSKMSGLKLNDYNCGFKCYTRQLNRELNLYGELHRFVPFLAHQKGFKVKEIPVLHHEHKYGSSKFGFERYACGFFDLLTVVFLTNYLHRPMHLFGWACSAFFFTGLAIFSYLFFGRWIFGESIGTSPLFSISTFLTSIGTQIYIAGLVAELIAHYKEQRDINNYSIRDVVS